MWQPLSPPYYLSSAPPATISSSLPPLLISSSLISFFYSNLVSSSQIKLTLTLIYPCTNTLLPVSLRLFHFHCPLCTLHPSYQEGRLWKHFFRYLNSHWHTFIAHQTLSLIIAHNLSLSILLYLILPPYSPPSHLRSVTTLSFSPYPPKNTSAWSRLPILFPTLTLIYLLLYLPFAFLHLSHPILSASFFPFVAPSNIHNFNKNYVYHWRLVLLIYNWGWLIQKRLSRRISSKRYFPQQPHPYEARHFVQPPQTSTTTLVTSQWCLATTLSTFYYFRMISLFSCSM